MTPCPCNPAKQFSECCKLFLCEQKTPPSPQVLMRSRFSAYARQDEQYLLNTWHQSTRPRSVDMGQSPKWLSLQIIKTFSEGRHGMVEFKASYMQDNEIALLHETSRFTKENGCWFYVDGYVHKPQQGQTGRNAPCPCGSGRKFKRCCL